jgi:hypothetical protein
MPSKFFELVGIASNVLFGKTGGRIRSASGSILEARDNADAAYAIMRGATPVGNNDLATKLYVDGGTTIKEAFFLADPSGNLGDLRVRAVAGTGGHRFDFSIPQDFSALVSIELLGFPNANFVNQNIDLYSDYAAEGQLYSTHSETDTTSVYSMTQNTLYALDLSSVLTQLAAGDVGGVFVDHLAIGTTVNYLGIRLRYT